MGKARPVVIARALVSLAAPPAGQARICQTLLKTRHFRGHVHSTWHGRARTCQARNKSTRIMCLSIPSNGEPLCYPGGRLPVLFTTTCQLVQTSAARTIFLSFFLSF